MAASNWVEFSAARIRELRGEGLSYREAQRLASAEWKARKAAADRMSESPKAASASWEEDPSGSKADPNTASVSREVASSGGVVDPTPINITNKEVIMADQSVEGGTIVVETKKKKKKKYTNGTKDFQKVAYGAVRGTNDFAGAFSAGFANYQKNSSKSARKRKDGMVIDAPQNVAKALGKSLSKASDAPYEFVRAANTKTVRRLVRFSVQTVSFPFGAFLR